MAVTEAILHKLGGSSEASGRDPTRVIYSYTAQYFVTTDDPEDGPKVIQDHFRNTSSLPWIGKPYDFGNDFDGGAICQRINPTRIGHSNHHLVVVSFEPVDGGSGASEADGQGVDLTVTQNPLKWHDEIELTYTQTAAPIYGAHFKTFFPATIKNPFFKKDKFMPLVNSAMDPFDPVPEAELDMQILRITRNVFPYNAGTADQYIGTVNANHVVIDKPAYGFRKEIGVSTGKIKNISAMFQIANKTKFFQHTIEVHITPAGWRFSILDRGMNRRQMPGDKNEAGRTISDSDMKDYKPKVTPIRDQLGNPTLEPILLNGNGQPLELDKGKEPVYLIYAHYTEKDWSAIPW